MNEAEVQYEQYCIPLAEAKKHKSCEEYKKYCEEVFGFRVREEE